MMSCKEITERSTAFLERELPFWQALEFRMHVMMCRHCRALMGQLRKTIQVLHELPREPVPAQVSADLLQRYRERNRAPHE